MWIGFRVKRKQTLEF
uniref:Uncharacterized protein n=1 Tax=Arundo donax TaxID=35708 RepID=A0A0A8YKG7_ARUDO